MGRPKYAGPGGRTLAALRILPVRVAYISSLDPANVRNWSGLVHYIYEAVARQEGVEMVPLAPLIGAESVVTVAFADDVRVKPPLFMFRPPESVIDAVPPSAERTESPVMLTGPLHARVRLLPVIRRVAPFKVSALVNV